MKYTEPLHDLNDDESDNESNYESNSIMEELADLIGSDEDPDVFMEPKPSLPQRNLIQYSPIPPVPEEPQSPGPSPIIQMHERKIDPNIPIIHRSPNSMPPPNVSRNLKEIEYIEKDGVQIEMRRYYKDNIHVYSMLCDKPTRKRAKFSHTPQAPDAQETKFTTNQMKVVMTQKIVPITIDTPPPVSFPVDDSTTAIIRRKHLCKIPREAHYLSNTRDMMHFPHLTVAQLKEVDPEFGKLKNPMSMKEIAWRAEGRLIQDPLDVYPYCGVPECYNPDHLKLSTKEEYLRGISCIGTVYYVDYNHVYVTQTISTHTQCKTHCKKVYVHVYNEKPITSTQDPQHPFNVEESSPPVSDYVDRTSKIPAMRLTVTEAKDLYDTFVKQHAIGYCEQKFVQTIADKNMQDAYRNWNQCVNLEKPGKEIYSKVRNKMPSPVLKIPKIHYLYPRVKEVSIRNLVWRAYGHSITDGNSVYTTCQQPDCVRYEHLVAESPQYYKTREFCAYVVCFKDGQVNSIINHCNHDRKCRIVETNKKAVIFPQLK